MPKKHMLFLVLMVLFTTFVSSSVVDWMIGSEIEAINAVAEINTMTVAAEITEIKEDISVIKNDVAVVVQKQETAIKENKNNGELARVYFPKDLYFELLRSKDKKYTPEKGVYVSDLDKVELDLREVTPTTLLAINAYIEARGELDYIYRTQTGTSFNGVEMSVLSVVNRQKKYDLKLADVVLHVSETEEGCNITSDWYSWYCGPVGSNEFVISDKAVWVAAYKATQRVVKLHREGKVPLEVAGITHYFNPDKVRKPPYWSKKKRPTIVLGNHQFYEGIY